MRPETYSGPFLVRGDWQNKKNSSLPYKEHVEEEFTCALWKVLPGKESTSFKLYKDDRMLLSSSHGDGNVVEKQYNDTFIVDWKFNASFDRTDNGATLRCSVHWEAGTIKETMNCSHCIDNIEVLCKYLCSNLSQ